MTTSTKDKLPSSPGLIFMGTPGFAVPTLRALIDHGYNILSVITQPDRPKGRGRKMTAPPVKKLALEHGIEVLQPERASDDHLLQAIDEKAPDLMIVIAYGQILKKRLLSLPGWGVINIHASLLPKYRGAAPIQWAVLNDESWTGLTVMRMDEGMDTGPILFQKGIPIFEDETAGQLHDRLAREAGDLMVESLKNLSENPVREISQDDSRATYAPKIGRELSRVDWKQSANKVSALIRGLDPWPGVFTTFQGKEVKLFSSRVADPDRSDTIPGRVVMEDGGLHVETGQGVVEIREIQYPGKKRITASDFLRGFSLPEGTILSTE